MVGGAYRLGFWSHYSHPPRTFTNDVIDRFPVVTEAAMGLAASWNLFVKSKPSAMTCHGLFV